MGKEIIHIADALSNERAIPRDKIFEALEFALATATKKKYNVDILARVDIDRKSGAYRTYRRWEVVDDAKLLAPSHEITLSAARVDNSEIQVGDFIEEEIDSVEFDRITTQTAKQVLTQKVKDAEKEQIIEAQKANIGQVITAIVKKSSRDSLVVDLGNGAEAVLKREQLIPHETFGRGDRIKVYLSDIKADGRGSQIICSRTCPEFLAQLFRIEVPEIGEDVIEIVAVARDPGSRSKIAVRSKDKRIDPRGACIGMRGARVMTISNELAGEKIDIVLYNENLAQYVTNAMEPAEVSRIIINEDNHSIDIAVADENLALAIGRNGQNVRLASQLLKWDLKVKAESEMAEEIAKEENKIIESFTQSLNIDTDFAIALLQAGFTSIEEIAYVAPEEFLEIDGMTEDIVETLQDNAKNALIHEENQKLQESIAKLTVIKEIDEDLAKILYEANIKDLETLAEQASDDISSLDSLDEEKAGKIIMAARNECWFKEDK